MPWARSFCPFRACGAYMRYLNIEYRKRLDRGVGTLSLYPGFDAAQRFVDAAHFLFVSFVAAAHVEIDDGVSGKVLGVFFIS